MGESMVKTVVLVRHGEPEKNSASGLDLDRRLTKTGARALAQAYPTTFGLLGEEPAVELWSSPAVRALETAQAVADAIGVDDIAVKQSLYAQDQMAFLADLEAAEAECVVAVGHVPFMDQMVARLTGVHLSFGKGAAAAVSVPSGPSVAGSLLWFVAGPSLGSWEDLASVEEVMANAASELHKLAKAFVAKPEDAEALKDFRIGLRRMRSLLQFLEPWQAKKQNRGAERLIKGLQASSTRLRALDVLSTTVDELVDAGELGDNSLLSMACAKERQLECGSLVEHMRKERSVKELKALASDLKDFRWKAKVNEKGLSCEDFRQHFDAELAKLDDDLFGLDLRDGNAVFEARRDAKEIHYIAERLGCVLGPERAIMSEYMDAIQTELGALSDARRNKRLADDCAKSPRFRGVRADLGVVARDQTEAISALTSGLEHMETRDEKGVEKETTSVQEQDAD